MRSLGTSTYARVSSTPPTASERTVPIVLPQACSVHHQVPTSDPSPWSQLPPYLWKLSLETIEANERMTCEALGN